MRGELYRIACPVSQQRHSQPIKRGQYQFAQFPCLSRLATLWINNFRQISGFEHMQNARLRGTFVCDWASFGHSMMIEHARATPRLAYTFANRIDTATGFASDNHR